MVVLLAGKPDNKTGGRICKAFFEGKFGEKEN
jgi:hypothetical protein